MRIGFAAIPYDKKLLPVTSTKSAGQTMERLMAVAKYVHRLGIDFYRIPANISPHESMESLGRARDDIIALGVLFKSFSIRTCFHATYYCILNSPKPEVLENSIKELQCMCFYDRLADGGNHIEIHAGGVYGDRQGSMDRLIDNVLKLDEPIIKMLRFENEEHPGKLGTIDELLHLNRETGIPLVFDVAHYRVNPLNKKMPVRELAEAFLDTWKGASTFPVVHFSTIRDNIGTHLPVDPHEFWIFVNELGGLKFDVMLETKEKERDVLKVKSFKNGYLCPQHASSGP
jgi:UV DNA damage endonuclease